MNKSFRDSSVKNTGTISGSVNTGDIHNNGNIYSGNFPRPPSPQQDEKKGGKGGGGVKAAWIIAIATILSGIVIALATYLR